MDKTTSTHVSRSSFTMAHNKDENIATVGQCMDLPTEIKYKDDIGWYTYVRYIMTQTAVILFKKC